MSFFLDIVKKRLKVADFLYLFLRKNCARSRRPDQNKYTLCKIAK